MHFVVNDKDYFDLEIEEPTTIQTADKFHGKLKIVDDLEIVELEADFSLRALKTDAELWRSYAKKYPVI